MRDGFGREIDYMRISVIDSCNLNCYYCNPCENNEHCRAVNMLSVKKVLCIVRAATRLGITHFRLTGGEPLLHPQLDEMVSQIKKLPGVSSVSLTTNAVLLAQRTKRLKEAGIDSINVSLDTIDASEYECITQKPLLKEVENGIDAAIECGIRVKINAVLTQQTDVVALTRYAEKKGADIRFIEMMPVGEGHTNGVEPYEKVIGALSEVYGESCCVNTERTRKISSGHKNPDNGPAEYFSFPGLGIRVGLIQAIHGKFCGNCNRIRVTADGRLMPCLGSSVTIDLLPDSCDLTDDLEKDFVIAQALKAAIKAKPKCHNFSDEEVLQPESVMYNANKNNESENAFTYKKTTEIKTTEIKAADVNAARNMSRIGG
ncbi:GTP 3',8-cyclase MoaA [Agathobacter sp.]|uniref:GTP 3',8-cyclase MoaA n=1 Tax=Agathobacter sp. TaxID=2021311 RepID=UPI003FD7B45E